MLKKIIAILILNLFFIKVYSQQTEPFELKEITIVDSLIVKDSGYKNKKIDSIALFRLQYHSLGEMLSKHAPIFIKTYGQGGLSSASFRGTGASHTKVLWNGLEINSAMLGQTDFSTLSANMINEVEMLPGGSSLQKGSGALGGSVIMNNTPFWHQKNNLNAKISIGSFNTYNSFLSYKIGNDKWMTKTKIDILTSKNNYSFLNNFKDRVNPPRERRKDCNYEHYNLMQELYVKTKNGGLLSANIWMSRYFRKIAPPLSVSTANRKETQNNDDIRGFIAWKKQIKKLFFTIQSAYLYDNLHYVNNISIIDSKNAEHKFIQQVDANYALFPNLSLSASVHYTHFNVQSNNYGDEKIRDDITGYVSFEWTPHPLFNLRLNIREKITDQRYLPIIPSFGMDWRIKKDIPLYLKANISRNYRTPTLNDLYWNPGGNPDLKPEKGFSYETGLKFVQQKKHWKVTSEVTYFDQFITDWIIWLPDAINSYWTPNNIRKVRANGLEADMEFIYRQKDWHCNFSAAYNLTQSRNMFRLSANDLSYKKQLIYVPKHSANAALSINYKKVGLHTIYHYTGKRFLNSDNTAYMPKFYTFDMTFDYGMQYKDYQILLALKVNNILDYPYQIIAWYPMPGRSVSFSITLKI